MVKGYREYLGNIFEGTTFISKVILRRVRPNIGNDIPEVNGGR